ncbi:anti-sigma factor family protein [Gemmatimonas sp.]
MTDHSLETIVAGVRCREVLADLSDYLDGALTPARVEALQAHLAECSNCARFGGHVARTLAMLRQVRAHDERDVVNSVMTRILASS